MQYAVYNPHNKPVEELPVIYGFNNGGRDGLWYGCLIAQDGTWLGSHGCSSEGYMLGDLGIVEGRRADRHEGFREHYPNGYRMDFVSYDAVKGHDGLQAAFAESDRLAKEAASDDASDASDPSTAAPDIGTDE